MTDAERKLWRLFRSHSLSSYKFRRQHHVGPYIGDFVCVEARLIVEADGGQHCESLYDAKRTAWLEQHGWQVVRFWNNEILQNPNVVAETILNHVAQLPLPNGRGRGPLRQQWEGEGANSDKSAPSPVSLRSTTSPVKGEVNEAQKLIGISLEGSVW